MALELLYFVVVMPIERAKRQLLVIISGWNFAHMKDNTNIFPIGVITSGSNDCKLPFSALNSHSN